MSNILMVIAPDQFRDEELFEPLDIFQAKGCKVIVATTVPGEAKGMLGKTYNVTEAITNQDADDFDAIVIVGGMGSPEHLWNNTSLIQLIKEFNGQDKLIAAICLSGVVLAKAGVLEGKKATVWDAPESRDAFESCKFNYIEEPVVTDGKIITANGPEAAKSFAEAILTQLAGVGAV